MNCTCPCTCKPVVDPNQIKLDFGYNANSKDYERGYDTGYTWDANWMPGGPHVYYTRSGDLNEKHRKMEADSKRAYDEWHAGFKVGLAARLVENRHFARWWKANKGKPYTVINGKSNINEVRYYG